MTHEIHVIDSHTAGEPTRVVVAGGPDLGHGTLAEKLERFRARFDHYRCAIALEPRGSDVLVGALLCEPALRDCVTGVIFFNNVGFLGMCGHGLIGVVTTLKYMGHIDTGQYRIETTAGAVTANLHGDESVRFQNVRSFRKAKNISITVDSVGRVVGDVAWGGNWFFLVTSPTINFEAEDRSMLVAKATAIRNEINESGYPEVDHIELFGEAGAKECDSRNFVLCPGLQYDRSPCGTGTSAKIACLAADGKLAPDQQWRQQGILGTSFRASYRWADEDQTAIVPSITGTAHVISNAKLRLDPSDPFCWGITDSMTSNVSN